MDRVNSNYRGKQKNWVLLNHILDGHLNSLTEFNLNFHLQRQSKQDPNPIVLYHHHIRCMKSLRNTYLKKMSNPDEGEREGGRGKGRFAPSFNFLYLLGTPNVLSENIHQVRRNKTNVFRISTCSYSCSFI